MTEVLVWVRMKRKHFFVRKKALHQKHMNHEIREALLTEIPKKHVTFQSLFRINIHQKKKIYDNQSIDSYLCMNALKLSFLLRGK